MEKNQEHKIDKIFNKSLENQSVTPPMDAWMAVHTYTIGLEESKKRIWFKYASLAILLLLCLGLGWHYLNLDFPPLSVSPQTTVRSSSVETQTTAKIHQSLPVAGLPTSPPVRKHTQKVTLLTSRVNVLSVSSSAIVHKRTPTLLTPDVDGALLSYKVVSGDTDHGNKGEKVVSGDTDHGNRVQNPNSVEIFAYSKDNINSPNIEKQIKSIETKPLILNDLSDKMQKEATKKIVGLEEIPVREEEISEDDSTIYGKKFSLKHPIVTFGTGVVWNDWSVKTNDYNIYTPSFNSGISKTSFIRLGITWKVNKKSRLGFNIGMYNSGSFIMGWRGPITSSSIGFPQIIFNSDNSSPSYIAETPFGNVKIPINTLTNNGFNIDVSNPPKAIQVVYGSDLHSLTYTQGEISIENDLLSRKRKSGYSYQLYLVSNLTFQRQISYNYWARDIVAGSSSSAIILPNKIFITENHLANGADIVWGVKYGFGFRWQFAKKWNFNIEGVMQNNLNSWVKNQPYTTNQKSYSIQTGIQLNL